MYPDYIGNWRWEGGLSIVDPLIIHIRLTVQLGGSHTEDWCNCHI